MKIKLLVATSFFIPAMVMAQSSPNMLGTWTGMSNSAVSGAGHFHPTEAGKEKAVRFRSVEYVMVIDKEEGRNFEIWGGRLGRMPSQLEEMLIHST